MKASYIRSLFLLSMLVLTVMSAGAQNLVKGELLLRIPHGTNDLAVNTYSVFLIKEAPDKSAADQVISQAAPGTSLVWNDKEHGMLGEVIFKNVPADAGQSAKIKVIIDGTWGKKKTDKPFYSDSIKLGDPKDGAIVLKKVTIPLKKP